jgi:purine-binding chemotaxis protein CheW
MDGAIHEPLVAEELRQDFGLIELGGTLVALPVSSIREVTSARPLSPLPGLGPGLRGTLDLRGDIIPVLDLHEHLGLPEAKMDPSVIVVLRHEGRLIGLFADAVCGMARPSPVDVMRLDVARGTRPILVTHSFMAGGRSATVLDPVRIMNLEGVPSVAEPLRRGSAHARLANSHALLTFRCGDVHFGVDALCVDATVPSTEVERNALTAGWCMGVIRHHGKRVAILDACALFGVGDPASIPARTEAVVLRLGGGERIALAIDAVSDIRRVAAAELIPLPSIAAAAPRFLSALLPESAVAQPLIIDMDVVKAAEPIKCIARGAAGAVDAEVDVGAGLKPNADAVADRRPYLVFQAGRTLAVPLEDVTEIIRRPGRLAPLPTKRHGLLGVFVHKSVSVPLFDLVSLLGGMPSQGGSEGFALLVMHGEDLVGYAIESLNSIEMGRWRVDTRGDLAGRGRNLALIGVQSDARVLPSMDFKALFNSEPVQSTEDWSTF